MYTCTKYLRCIAVTAQLLNNFANIKLKREWNAEIVAKCLWKYDQAGKKIRVTMSTKVLYSYDVVLAEFV